MASNSQIAFAPLGETIAIIANATAPDGVQALAAERNSAYSSGQYRVVNSGSVPVHLGVGPTAATARTNAEAAVSGNPGAGIPLLPGAVEILRFGAESFFSGISASAQTIYITPGQGL